MTDNEQWQSPSSSGSYVPPVSPRPEGQPGWTPPPKPGLIPLRPLDFGTILGAPYRVLRRNPRPTFGVSLLIQGGILFLTFLIVGLAAYASFSRVDFNFESSTPENDQLIAGAFGATLLSSLIPIALSLVATGVMQGVLVLEAARQSVGEKLRFAQLWALAKGRVWDVAGYTVLLSLLLFIAVAIIVGIAVAISVLGGTGGSTALGVGIALLLGLGLIVLGAWIGTKVAFVPSIMMLERASMRQAIARSWTLTNRAFWKILGTLLLVAVIINVASSIVTAPVQLLASLLPALIAPTGDVTALVVVLAIVYILIIIVSLVVAAVALVIQSATTALLYIDQRIRKEGLDLELARYVEARQSGATGVPDPYQAVPSTPVDWSSPGAPSSPAQPAASPWA